MTIQTTHIRKTYTAIASQTIFVYDFLILDAMHLNITVNAVTKLLTTDYTVTNVKVPSGGNVVFNVGLNAGDTVIITRIVPLTQIADYVPNDPLPADVLEESFDKLTMAVQQLQDSIVVGGGGGAADAVLQALIAHINDVADTVHNVGTKISNHSGLNTGVHGVGGSVVESTVGSQAKVDAHKDLTTGVHGVGASTIESVLGSQTKVDNHNALHDRHGATSTNTANTPIRRDANGRAQVTDGTLTSDIATVNNVDFIVETHNLETTGVHGVGASTVESVSGSQAKVDTHNALYDRHGATDVNTANTPIRRDASGNAKVSDGVAASDIATKGQVDVVGTNLTNHVAATTGIHGVGASTVESIAGSQAKVDAHKDLTTGVHGAGASTLETVAGSQAKVDTHAALTAPHASATSIGGKGLPTGAFVGDSDSQSLTNKTLQDSTTIIADNSDATKKLQFECSGITTSTTRTMTIPNASGTLVLETRSIGSDATITGGGDLSANRTLSVVANTSTQKVEVYKGAASVGTRKRLNFIEGSNITLTIADNAGADRVDITVDSAPGISSQDMSGSFGQDSFTATDTTFTLSCDAVKVMSAAYDTVLRVSPSNVTNNIGTAGPAANGRDQAAAFSSNSWIYFYWIWNGTTLASLSSTSWPTPVLPTGYTHWCMAAIVRYRTSALDYVSVRGNTVFYRAAQGVIVGATETAETTNFLTTYVPPKALSMLLEINTTMASTAGGAAGMQFVLRHTSTYDFASVVARAPAASQSIRNTSFIVIPNKSQTVYHIWSGSTTNVSSKSGDVNMVGYTVPNGGI